MRIVTNNLSEEFQRARQGLPPLMSSYNKPMARLSSDSEKIQGFRREAMGPLAVPYEGAAGVTSVAPELRNPYSEPFNLFIPEDHVEMNKWLRYYARMHPLFGSLVDVLSFRPVMDVGLLGLNKIKKISVEIANFWEDVYNDCMLDAKVFSISKEFELMGEAFPYMVYNSGEAYLDDIICLNPDYLDIDRNAFSFRRVEEIYFIPAPGKGEGSLFGTGPTMSYQFGGAGFGGAYAVPLNSDYIAHVAFKYADYELRGYPRGTRCIRELLYEDKLREVQLSIAGRAGNPYEIWNLGDADWVPGEDYLEAFQKTLIAGAYDPHFRIIAPYKLNVEFASGQGKLLILTPEYEHVQKRIMWAMLSTYENNPTLDGLIAYFFIKRSMINNYFKRKVFKKIAEDRGFKKVTPAQASHRVQVDTKKQAPIEGEEGTPKYNLTYKNSRLSELIIPDGVFTNPVRMEFDRAAALDMLKMLVDKSKAAVSTFAQFAGFDPEELKEQLKNEESTVFDPVYQKLREDASARRMKEQETIDKYKDNKTKKKPGEEEEKLAPGAETTVPGESAILEPGKE